MGLAPYITGAEQGIASELTLQRQHVFFGVGNAVAGWIGGYAANRHVLRPVHVGVGMAGRRVQGSQLHREVLAEILSGASRNEWSGKKRWSGAGVCGPIGSIRAQHTDAKRWDGGVEHPEPGSQACLAGTSQNFAEKGVPLEARRVGEPDARGEIKISRGCERARNSGI